jgi:hypothetical protein
VSLGVDDRLQERAVELEHGRAVGRRAFREHDDRVAGLERIGRAAVDALGVVAARALDEQRARPRISRPTTGQRASSDFATKRDACWAFSTKMSSHEMWFATIRRLPRRASIVPCTRASTFMSSRSRSHQRRVIARRRSVVTRGNTKVCVAMPPSTCTTRARRATRGSAARRSCGGACGRCRG